MEIGRVAADLRQRCGMGGAGNSLAGILGSVLHLRAARRASFFVLLAGLAMPAYATPAETMTALAVTSSGDAVTLVSSGTVVTLTATVASGVTPVTVGQVNFCDASATYCTDIHRLGMAQLTASGTAVLKLKPGIGAHSYRAVFAGTNSYLTSASGTASLEVSDGTIAPTVTIAPSGSAGNYTLTATIASHGIPLAPSGTISFLDTTNSNHELAKVTLSTDGLVQSFTASGENHAVGHGLRAVATGDFNGDGVLDLAVANNDDGTVSVLLGNGDGSFQTQKTYATGAEPYAIAVGEFNGDGFQDLAIINLNNSTVSILLGNGDGSFQTPKSYATGNIPCGVAVGDFNRDGVLDLATASNASYTVSVLLGNGDGSFQTPKSFAVGNYPDGVAVGDFNRDGVLDLVAANWADKTVSVLLGKEDGSFEAQVTYATGDDVYAVAAADFNGDGVLDLAVANSGDYTAGILLGNVDGTFQAQKTYATGNRPQSIAVADFNGDGIPDFEVTNYYANIGVMLNQGDGSFQLQGTYLSTLNPVDSTVGDFNGDGLTDIASIDLYTGAADILFHQWSQTASVSGISPVPAGAAAHLVEASYSGDSLYSAGVSPAIRLLTAQTTPTLTLASNLSSSIYGTPVMLTATLSPYTEQGYSTDGETVTFKNGSSTLGTGTLSSGMATLTLPSLATKSYALTAFYGGDTNFIAATSNTVGVTVGAATPVLTLNAATASYGASFTTLTAYVVYTGGSAPSGTASIAVDSGLPVTATCTGPSSLLICTASYPTGSLAVGNHTMVAVVAADSNYSMASDTATLTITAFSAVNTPTLTTLSPAYTTAGSADFTLTANGSNFVSGLTVYFGATALTTTYVSATQLTATVPAALITSAATYSVTVGNSSGTSNAMNFAVIAASVPTTTPALSALSPAYTTAGGAPFTLALSGANFVSSSTVYFGPTALTTTYVSATQLTATIPAALIASVGIFPIAVVNPSSGGTSAAMDFAVSSSSGSSNAPTITTTSVTISAGDTASYSITVPSTVSSLSVTCLNLPAGASCSYSSGKITITTSSITPSGTYTITFLFTELTTTTAGWVGLPLLLLPLYLARKKLRKQGVWVAGCVALIALAGVMTLSGCGSPANNTSTSTSTTSSQSVYAATATLTVK